MKNMNSKMLLTSTLAALVLNGCGEYKKNPVGEDLVTIRQQGKTIQEMGPQKPVVITNTHVVEKPKEVVREESTIDDKFIVISADQEMSFNEGDNSTYKVRARVLVPGIQIRLEASNLPQGAKFAASTKEKDLYELSWTPDINTIPSNQNMKSFSVKVTAKVTSIASTVAQNQNSEILKNLVREKDLSLFLFRNQQLPSDLKILGLSNEVQENAQPVAFSVTAKIPGINDKTTVKPRVVVSYDGISYTAGNNFLELDGSRYVIPKDAVYMGDFVWKFNFAFDTKNIAVQPQLAKDGTFLATADGTRVRLSFKVYSPYGLSTPETLHQLKVKYDLKARGQQSATEATADSKTQQPADSKEVTP